MWEGHENALCRYGLEMCDEWIRRGYEDTCRPEITRLIRPHEASNDLPKWWGGPIHASHRASLLHRLPEWYSQFRWTEAASDDPLFWPVLLLSRRKFPQQPPVSSPTAGYNGPCKLPKPAKPTPQTFGAAPPPPLGHPILPASGCT